MIIIPRNAGKIFEDEFRDSIDKNILYYQRIKDPASSFGQDSSKTRFSIKNPYDVFVYKYPNFFALELKSTKSKSLTFSVSDNKSQIKKCQIDGLTDASKFYGIFAGFVFNFRTQELTYYLSIEDFNSFIKQTNKQSISIEDIALFGGVVIPQKIKRTKYIYNVDIIFNTLGEKNCE